MTYGRFTVNTSNRFEQKPFPAIFAFRITKELCVLRFNVYVLIICVVFNVLIRRVNVRLYLI
jgi:hypothetical protein